MDEYILTYLQDVLDSINEMESYFIDYPMHMRFLNLIF